MLKLILHLIEDDGFKELTFSLEPVSDYKKKSPDYMTQYIAY